MTSLPTMPPVTVDEIVANSFRDFHAKGLDYICLRRSPTETVKLYFFDGDVSKLPEVVNPHDHRYDFKTLCVAGLVENIWFERDADDGLPFDRFEYRTPLLGGANAGFTYSGTDMLRAAVANVAGPGDTYDMRYDEIHTIRMRENNTVIALVQYEDMVTSAPTLTFTRDREPPSLDGLYNRFTPDAVLKRLDALHARVPGLILPKII